jgi:energy-coupling factor transport system ATP-binding protein
LTIEVRDLHFTYAPAHPQQLPQPALRGASFEAPQGQFIALLGRVGAGKSTLCMALNGLVPQATGGVFRGDVIVDGLNTKRHSVAELAAHTGLVFQDPESQIIHTRVEDEVAFGPENLGIPPQEIAQRIAWALDATGLSEHRDRPPLLLSGGEKQRVAIAALLAMRPGVLVLDEPTASLDPAGKAAVFKVLYRLAREHGMTVIMATQELDRAFRYADRILVLHEGVIALDGAPASILSQPEKLDAWGIGLPEMAELAQRLTAATGRSHRFRTPGSAYVRLRGQAGARPPAAQLDPPQPAGKPLVQIEGLWYAYEGRPALQGVGLTLHRGDFVALMGRNGSGKTTLARHINGLLKPASGAVRVNGEDTRKKRVAELARQVGYVFQNPDHQIFAPTVHQEVAFGLHAQGLAEAEVAPRVADALARFGLADAAGLPPASLGFGQRRLVALASVLATQPALLILDEPTDGLDARSQHELMDEVVRFNREGGAVLLITHDVRLAAEYAPRAVVLAAGRVLFDGTSRQLFWRADMLAQAGLRPPQVKRLAERLGLAGADVLTPAEFVAAWQPPAGGW